MILPRNIEDLTDEELLQELTKTYKDPQAARYILKFVRGRVTPPYPLR